MILSEIKKQNNINKFQKFNLNLSNEDKLLLNKLKIKKNINYGVFLTLKTSPLLIVKFLIRLKSLSENFSISWNEFKFSSNISYVTLAIYFIFSIYILLYLLFLCL